MNNLFQQFKTQSAKQWGKKIKADLFIDIQDNILVAAANYNGYFIFNMNDNYEIIDTTHIRPI